MADEARIVIAGVSGRMGQMLVKTVGETKGAIVSGAIEREGHDWVGRDLGEAMGGAATGVTVTDDTAQALNGADVLIDFTAPAASVAFAKAAAAAGVAHICGTTGLTDDDIAAIEGAAQGNVLVRAGNMSLGVNLLVKLTEKVAAALDEDFDIEVVEMHHHHKVDAPSGTALMLGEAAATGRGVALKGVRDSGRDGITGARKRGDIGFAALRGGDVVGEHDVIFAAAGERIVLRHLATDRQIFARGAVKAALWARGRAPGHYSMMHVLGL